MCLGEFLWPLFVAGPSGGYVLYSDGVISIRLSGQYGQTDATRAYRMAVSFNVFACRSALFGHAMQRVPAQAFPEFGSQTLRQQTRSKPRTDIPWRRVAGS